MKTNPVNWGMRVAKCLTNEWQTTAQIAAQVVFPPDRITRCYEYRIRRKCVSSVKSNIVGRYIYSLQKRGLCEKTVLENGKQAYMKNDKTDVYIKSLNKKDGQ